MGINAGTIEPEGLITIRTASWELYELLLRDLGQQRIGVTYDDGIMVLASPVPAYARLKKLIGRLVELATLELRIPISSFGATTWKRKDLAKGIEAEDSYYIRNEPKVRGRTDIDLTRDPPPDLAVEIDPTVFPVDRLRVYAAIGVPELWRYDGHLIGFIRLMPGGVYAGIDKSDALPFITPTIVEKFVGLMLKDETGGMRDFQKWLRALPSN